MEISENFGSLLRKYVEGPPPPNWPPKGESPNHWRHGSTWSTKAFLLAVGFVKGGPAPVQKTYENWIAGRTTPEMPTLNAILHILFGDEFSLAGPRDALICAWKAARAKNADTANTATPRPASPMTTKTASEWVSVIDRRVPHPWLVNGTVDKPPQGSEPASFDVIVEVIPGLERCENDSDYWFALRSLWLSSTPQGCLPVRPGPDLDDRVPGHVKRVAVGWQIAAPPGQHLSNTHAAVLTAKFVGKAGEAPSVKIEATAARGDVAIIFDEKILDTLTEYQRSVLEGFLKKKKFPTKETAKLAWWSVAFKPAKP